MPEYRRNRAAGGCYFFTVNLRDRRSDLLVLGIDTLRRAVRDTKARHPFHIDAWVVLPDHMHCIWTLPPEDFDFPLRWQRRGLAVLQLFAVRDARPVSGELGDEGFRAGRDRRAVMTCDGGLKPTLPRWAANAAAEDAGRLRPLRAAPAPFLKAA